MKQIEIISAFTGEVLAIFGNTQKEKNLCTQALSKVDIKGIFEDDMYKKVYVLAFTLE